MSDSLFDVPKRPTRAGWDRACAQRRIEVPGEPDLFRPRQAEVPSTIEELTRSYGIEALKRGEVEYRPNQVLIIKQFLEMAAKDANASMFYRADEEGRITIPIIVASWLLSQPQSRVLILTRGPASVREFGTAARKLLVLPEEEIGEISGEVRAEDRAVIHGRSPRLLVSTPGASLSDWRAGGLSLRDFSLVVFDDAHLITADNHYGAFASEVRKQRQATVGGGPMLMCQSSMPGRDTDDLSSRYLLAGCSSFALMPESRRVMEPVLWKARLTRRQEEAAEAVALAAEKMCRGAVLGAPGGRQDLPKCSGGRGGGYETIARTAGRHHPPSR